MAHRVLWSNRRRNTHEFFVDTVDDLQKLAKEPASTALIATTGDKYIYTNGGEWVKFNKGICPHGGSDDSESGGNTDITLGNLGTIYIESMDGTYDLGELNVSIGDTPIAFLHVDNDNPQYIAGGLNCVLDCPGINVNKDSFNVEATLWDGDENETPFTDFTYNAPSQGTRSTLLTAVASTNLQIIFTMPDIPYSNQGDRGGITFNITWDEK